MAALAGLFACAKRCPLRQRGQSGGSSQRAFGGSPYAQQAFFLAGTRHERDAARGLCGGQGQSAEAHQIADAGVAQGQQIFCDIISVVNHQAVGVGRQDGRGGQQDCIVSSGFLGPNLADVVQAAPCGDVIGGFERSACAEAFEDAGKHLFGGRFDGFTPDAIGFGGEQDACKGHGFGGFGDVCVRDLRTCTRKTAEGVFKSLGGAGAQIFERYSVEDEEAGVAEARACKVGGFAGFEGGKEQGTVFDAAGQWTNGVELLAQGHGSGQRQAAVAGFQADKIVPRGGDADGTAGVRTNRGGGEAVGDRSGTARGRAARDGLFVIDAGRGGGDGVEAEAREGEFGHMGFTKANKALAGGSFQNSGVVQGYAVFQQGRSGFGGDACGVEQVFPTDGHAIQQAPAQARFGAGGCAHRFAARTGRGGTGVDPGGMFMDGDFFEEKLGQFNGVNATFADVTAKLGGGHVGPGFAHVIPHFAQA